MWGFIANSTIFPKVKEFRKSVKIWIFKIVSFRFDEVTAMS